MTCTIERARACIKVTQFGSNELCDDNNPCVACKPILKKYGMYKGFFARLWNNTIFPDMIRRRKEEKSLMTKLQHEAKLEALRDSKEELKQHYKEKELERLKGGGGGILKKIGNDLAGSGFKLPSSDKIGSAFGGGRGNTNTNQNVMGMNGNSGGMFDQNKISSMIGGNRTPNPKTPNHYSNNRFDSDRLSGLIKNKCAPQQQVAKKPVTKTKKKTKKRK